MNVLASLRQQLSPRVLLISLSPLLLLTVQSQVPFFASDTSSKAALALSLEPGVVRLGKADGEPKRRRRKRGTDGRAPMLAGRAR